MTSYSSLVTKPSSKKGVVYDKQGHVMIDWRTVLVVSSEVVFHHPNVRLVLVQKLVQIHFFVLVGIGTKKIIHCKEANITKVSNQTANLYNNGIVAGSIIPMDYQFRCWYTSSILFASQNQTLGVTMTDFIWGWAPPTFPVIQQRIIFKRLQISPYLFPDRRGIGWILSFCYCNTMC